jgi:alkylation response protein AidB-like acyl-CoA dehydrogenase
MVVPQPVSPTLLAELFAHAGSADAEPVWPARSWDVVARAGALRWCIPEEYGGAGLGRVELLRHYRALAGACMTSCLLLSQRDAACRRLLDSGNEALCRRLLPPLARGEQFATVGLSQLTTARQHLGPACVARDEGSTLMLEGTVPWVTGAARAEHIVTGAVLPDGRQVLVVLPTALPGVAVGPSLDLMALEGSLTAEVRCAQVRLGKEWLLAGPAKKVLQGGRGGAGGLETSCYGLGLAGAALEYLRKEAEARPALAPGTERLHRGWQKAWQELERLAQEGGSAEAASALRGRANTLVLQATQAALTASKGTGFVRPHPAQRWARQALFFLVWSCPWPAAAATLAYLTADGEPSCP